MKEILDKIKNLVGKKEPSLADMYKLMNDELKKAEDDMGGNFFPEEKVLTPEQLEKAKQFTSTKMLAQNIAQVVQIFDKDQCAKVKQKVDDITEYIGGDKNTFAVVLGRDKYDTKSFNLNALGLTFNLTTEILDENLDVRSIEKTEEFQTKEGDKYRMQEAYDLKNNTISKTRYEYE